MNPGEAFDFLAGGGMMGAAMRGHDWAATPLGRPDMWPQPLRTLVTVLLGSSQPMFVVWGAERSLLYNDAYAEIMAGKHPAALGRDFLEVWSEIRADLIPIVEQAYAGQPVRMDDIELLMDRRGYLEETHFAFSYTPVRDEAGAFAGFLCACTEITEQVLANRRRIAETERQRRLFERAPGFIAILSGPDHRFEFVNEAYRRLVGDRACIGCTVREALPDLVGQGFFQLLDQVYGTGERHVAHHTSIRLQPAPDAPPAERFLDFIYEPIIDEAGQVTGIFVEGHDVTDAHRAQQALLEREAQLRLIVDGARDYAILTTDPQRRITSWSAGAEAAFGLTAAEAIGRSADETFTPEDRAAGQPEAEMATAAATGLAVDQRWHLRADGGLVFMSGSVHPLPRDEHGRERGYIKIARDETRQRRQAEDLARTQVELVESEDRFRTLAEAAPALIFAAEHDRGNSYVNQGYLDYTGRPAEMLLGHCWREVVHPDDLRDLDAQAADPAADGLVTRLRIRRRDGEWRWFACRTAPLRDAVTGTVARLLGTCLDIDDQIRAEARLRDLNETLEAKVAERAAELAAAQDQLRQSQKLEAIGQLTGGVAHDFNNLLTVIRSSADLLRRPELPEAKRRRYIDAIADTADRAAKLTGQLLAFARRQALQPEIFDVAARLAAVNEMLRTVLGARIALEIETPCAPCHVEADPGQFETALVNMAVNARDAMGGEGTLRIVVDSIAGLPAIRGHAGSDGSFVTVAVCDTGSGIAPADLPRVFEPFFTTKEVGKGTGLGLSQVFGFAKQSGGEIHVESDVGHGTTFTLYLPRVEAANDAVQPERAREPIAAGRGRVLVVEDNVQVGEFAAQLLEDLGYRTELAGNAAEALARLERDADAFDVVFTDVVMPGMGGVELGQTVRRRWPGLPVILTSGYSHVLAADTRHGFPLLDKPYSVEGLSRVLRDTATTERRRAGER